MGAVSFLGVRWVFPHSIKQALESWKGQALGKKRKEAWMAGPLYTWLGLCGRRETRLSLKIWSCPFKS